MKQDCSKTKGFTFIEILVAIAIILVLATVSVTTFSNMGTSSSHRVAVQEVYTMLTEAQSRTLASDTDTVYGVHFEQGSTTLFSGTTFVDGDATNRTYTFTGGTYATGSLVSTGDIIFRRLTGLTNATGTIYIVRGDFTATSSISVTDSGLIEN